MCPDGLVAPRRDIWSLGIPLGDAACEFAPEELRKAGEPPWQMAFVARTAGVILEGLKNTEQARNPRYAEAIRQVREADAVTTASMHAHIEMAEQLLSGIRSGQYVAYGYKRPRDVKNRRMKIPSDLFDRQYIDWKNSAVKSPDLEFLSVLVFESGLAPDIDAELKQSSASEHRSKRGPLPSSAEIEETIRWLIADQLLPNHDLQKQNIELIRKRVHELYPGEFPKDRGLSKESIRKALEKLIPRQRR
ncbi:MAG: hypothetical protein KGJ66_06245 [Alphaproteobacteria bacterium]|nr:hypothetical protein [Alphaproteobacteria bacterium]